MATTVIDNKVVEMRFDNKDFEKNIQQSMNSLDKLKQTLNMDSSKALDNLGKTANNFQLNGMTTALEEVSARFSGLQVVGMTVLSELTKAALNLGAKIVSSVLGPISSGGMNRALNIEQAKFQLEGLGVAWADIEDDINYGVKDTAYGLDVAAKAAAQLTASGVTLGENMKASLRGISGVAAMTNATYEEISPIFTTVAGQGKLMTMQLRQLEARGLNAAATLAKELNKTEAEIRQMVTDGEIDFQTFANAMDNAFGAHAKDANKTFTGAMSNVKAAMSRIGANFATPYMENMRLIFVSLIDVLNGVNKALQPVVQDVTKIMEMFQKRITNFLNSTGLKDGVIHIVTALRYAFYDLLLIVEPIRRAFRDIFPYKDINTRFKNATIALENFTKKLIISEDASQNLRETFKGVFAVFDILGQAFGALFRSITPFSGGLKSALGSVLEFTAGIGRFLVALSNYTRENKVFDKIFGSIAKTISGAVGIITGGISKITEAFKKFKENHIDDKDFSGFSKLIENLKAKMPTFESIGNVFSKVFEGIGTVLKNIGPYILKMVDFVGTAIGTLLKSSAEAVGPGNAFASIFTTFSSVMLGTLGVQIATLLGQFTKNLKNLGGISPLITNVTATLKQVQADLKADVFMKLAKAIAIFAGSILVLSLIEPARLAQSLGAIELLVWTITKVADTMNALTSGKGVFKSLGQAALLESFGRALTSLAVGVGILALSVKALGSMNLTQLAAGLGAVVLIINVLVSKAKELANSEKDMIKGAGMMITMAVAVRVFASAVKAMGSLPLADLAKGLGGTIVMLYALVGAVKLMDQAKLNVGTGVALIAVAAALLVLTNAVKALGEMNFTQLATGVVAVSALLLALAAFVKVISGTKGILLAGVGILATAAALKVLVGVVTALGQLDTAQLIQGGIAVAALLTALTLFSKFASGGNLLLSSAAILVFALAISSLTKSFQALGAMSIGDLVKVFVTLVAVIGGLALAASLLTSSGIIAAMAALSGVILILGVGVLALGAGVVALSAGLIALATAATVVVANIEAIALIINYLVPTIALALANGFVVFTTTLAANAVVMTQAVVALGIAICDGLIQLVPKIVEALGVILEAVITKTVEMTPMVTDAALEMFAGFMEGVTQALPRVVAAISNFVITLINTIADTIRNDNDELIAAVDNLMDALITAVIAWFVHFNEKGQEIVDKIAEGVTNTASELVDAAKQMVQDALDALPDVIKNVISLGKDFAQGFIDGVKGLGEKVVEGAKGLVDTAMSAIQEEQDSNSPSEKTKDLGEDFGEGYAIGITNMEDKIATAAQQVAEKAVDSVEDSNNDLADALDPITTFMDRYTTSAENADLATEDLKDEMNQMKNPASDYNKQTKANAEATDKFADSLGKAGKAAKEEKSNLEKLKDTISNQLDIFNKFEIKTGVTAQQMIDNMRSNIDGFTSWSKRMADLAVRFANVGIDQGLYQKLEELGPKGYETMNAFYQMSEEQLAEVRDLYATSLTLPDSQADLVNAGFTYMGEMATQGFSDALSQYGATTTAATGLGQAALDGLANVLKVHSPSEATRDIGMYTIDGLIQGLQNFQKMTVLRLAVFSVCNIVLSKFRQELSTDKTYEIGKNAVIGLANGLSDSEAASKVRSNAESIAKEAYEKMQSALKERSPSKITTQIGKYASLGLANGITDGSRDVARASTNVADMAVAGLQNAVDKINDFISLNINPIITPILDLSYMQEQMSAINSSFGVRSEGAGQIQNGDGSTATTSTGVTYVQNNYSPKELSRIDIYRNTKNQLSMIGKVVRANA